MTTRFTFKGNASLRDALIDLQDALASKQFGDVLDRMHRRRRQNKTSITRNRGAALVVKDLLVVKIRMQGDRTHGRPHAHIEYGGNYHKASYAIDTGARLAGGLQVRHDRAQVDRAQSEEARSGLAGADQREESQEARRAASEGQVAADTPNVVSMEGLPPQA